VTAESEDLEDVMWKMPGPPRSRSTVIVVLLFATLAITGVLAFEAHTAARSHRQTAENVLRDYSEFAAWELSRQGRQELLNAVHHGLGRIESAAKRDALSSVIGRAKGCPSGCGGTYRVISAFRISLPGGEFRSAGAPVDPRVRTVLSDAVEKGMRNLREFTCPALAAVHSDGETQMLVWRPVHDAQDQPIAVVGFVADPSFAAGVFERLLRTSPLLPPSLVPSGTNANAALSVRVTSAEGHPIFTSGGDWSAYDAESALARELGGLGLAVAIRPTAAEALVIGGLPGGRLPLIVTLLALTAGLVVVALVQLRRESELARLRSDFVSGVSHELRTPLAQIRMFTETLLLGRVRSPGESQRSLEIVSRETQRLIQLVENILLFSRGERRVPEIDRKRVALAPVVRDIVETFSPLASSRHATLTAALQDHVVADVDAGAVRQVLLNLLDNAVKYGPPGQTVRVRLDMQDGRARLSVEDEGPGVDPRDAARIWHPFTRVVSNRTATGGAGIGLSIVRQLVELHGGSAHVEQGERGARFVIELPGARREPHAVPAVA
jgi:signal transduction histidine kinase